MFTRSFNPEPSAEDIAAVDPSVQRALADAPDAVVQEACRRWIDLCAREHSKLVALQAKAATVVTQAGALGTFALAVPKLVSNDAPLADWIVGLLIAAGLILAGAVGLGVHAARVRPVPEIDREHTLDPAHLGDLVTYQRFLTCCYWKTTARLRKLNTGIAITVARGQRLFMFGFGCVIAAFSWAAVVMLLK